jgi:hypothetical protein
MVTLHILDAQVTSQPPRKPEIMSPPPLGSAAADASIYPEGILATLLSDMMSDILSFLPCSFTTVVIRQAKSNELLVLETQHPAT